VKTQEFLKLIGEPGRSNFFIVAPDDLGIGSLLMGALAPIAVPEDVYFYDAEGMSKEKARQLEQEARFASRSGSDLSHFYIYKLQRLPMDSVGPLLKVVEEARYARFIFQAQSTPRKIHTLMSRSNVVRLPFFSKKVVLGAIQSKNYDARTADELGLYDGTLDGTIAALNMKNAVMEIRRDLKRGMRGTIALMNPERTGSDAFIPAIREFLTQEERSFLRRQDSLERRQVVLFKVLRRTAQ